jgi:hypothetical protein
MKQVTGSDDQGPWRQFVLDHLDYIAKATRPVDLDILLINQYRYDLPRFLKERMGLRTDMAWIVVLLNNMTSDFDFKEPGTLIVPGDDTIINLYHSFSTITANAN